MHNDLKVGLEICKDRGQLSIDGEENLNLQILVSAGYSNTTPVIAEKSYFVCADRREPFTGPNYYVQDLHGGKWIKRVPVSKIDNMQVYDRCCQQ